MTFEDFFALCAKRHQQKRHWRVGQAIFNTLLDLRPDVANYIRDTEKDPFHATSLDDVRVASFADFIERFFPKTKQG